MARYALRSHAHSHAQTQVIYFCAAELGSVFYSVREKNFDERGSRRQADREFSKRAELETEMAKQREEYVFLSLCERCCEARD